jgi:raffinose/stachyose/melibiose transport system permease protein
MGSTTCFCCPCWCCSFVGFTVWPIVATWIYSLYAWDGFEPLQTFVGLTNFVKAARDPGYWMATGHTFTFSLAAIFIQVPLAPIIALILNNRLMFARNLYRTLIFLPVITTTAVIGVAFDVLLDPSGGPFKPIGLRTIPWPVSAPRWRYRARP